MVQRWDKWGKKKGKSKKKKVKKTKEKKEKKTKTKIKQKHFDRESQTISNNKFRKLCTSYQYFLFIYIEYFYKI